MIDREHVFGLRNEAERDVEGIVEVVAGSGDPGGSGVGTQGVGTKLRLRVRSRVAIPSTSPSDERTCNTTTLLRLSRSPFFSLLSSNIAFLPSFLKLSLLPVLRPPLFRKERCIHTNPHFHVLGNRNSLSFSFSSFHGNQIINPGCENWRRAG